MNRQVFITLPVAELSKSVAFFNAIGFSLNPAFTGEGAACIAISETFFVMLCPQAKFTEFSPKPMCDTSRAVEMLLAITCESRAQIDQMITRAEASGATIHERSVDYGFMYHSSFTDPDGHCWGLNYMNATPPQK
jgi:predicted lactoylglutathione lyase